LAQFLLILQMSAAIYMLPEIPDAVKGQVVGIMVIVCSAESIIKSGPADKNDIFPLKLPVYILKTMLLDVGMV